LHPDVVAYTLKRFEKRARESTRDEKSGRCDLRRQPVRSSAALRNNSRTSRRIFAGNTADLAKFEHQLAGVQARLKTSDPRTSSCKIRDTAAFCRIAARRLSALWAVSADRARGDRETRRQNHAQTDPSHVHRTEFGWLGVLEPRLLCGAGGPAWNERLPVSLSGWLRREDAFSCQRSITGFRAHQTLASLEISSDKGTKSVDIHLELTCKQQRRLERCKPP